MASFMSSSHTPAQSNKYWLFLFAILVVAAPSYAADSVKIVESQTLISPGQTVSLSVRYQTSVKGLVQLQLFNSSWKKVTEKSTPTVVSDNGQARIEIKIPADTVAGENYLWQAVLFDGKWKKLAEDTLTKVRVSDSSDDTPAPKSLPTEKQTNTNDVGESVPQTPSGDAGQTDQWVPPGDWQLEWADEFDGRGEPKNWYPLLGYDPTAFRENTAKGLRWSGASEDTAWMYSTKSGNHILDGKGHLVLRVVCDKTQLNEHGPKVNAGYLLTGYPEKWDSTEPHNAKWGGRFFSPADGPLYVSASVRSDQVVGHSTWFAFWLFSETRAYNGNPADGTEVDIVEIAKGAPRYMSHSFNVANHWKESSGSESQQFNAASRPRPTAYVDVTDKRFHQYGVEWSRDSMKCYVDGKLYYTFTENIPTDPVDMMILLTMEFKPNAWDPNQGDGRTEGPFVSDTPKMREMSRAV
ncbi:MAG: family 16 glycosylhydrolase, partial [Rhodopirellula sp. JB053]